MVKVTINDKKNSLDKDILIDNSKSILDNMIDNNVQVFYGCMGGSCGACKCEITYGIEFIEKEAIRPKVYRGVKENEVLTCIAKLKKDIPNNAQITIKKLL